ncbi:CRISPR system precrRNA processing endoribonuclease RAMP protein Cas6 [Pelagibius sp. CAU 1746]|uniref:CRISPR system precrRNA processing endoribonuclease RAMP protein Cas6 n=1 Tax=Pelagibius sp. CAU 1746 TaxID=3140370 RepID=UPI00325B09CD
MDLVGGDAVNQRLLAPKQAVSGEVLAALWSFEQTVVVLPGLGALQNAGNLLQKVRGAFGDALLAGASEPVRAHQPCNWHPPCAAEVFFGRKPCLRVAAHDSEIPKPFVLSSERVNQDLHVKLAVFGFASAWARATSLALAEALRNRVLWAKMAKDLSVFLPKRIELGSMRSCGCHGLGLGSAPAALRMDFHSPVDAERGSAFEQPEILLRRLLRRVALLARWHDVDLEADWDALEKAIGGIQVNFLDYAGPADGRARRRGGHRLKNRLIELPSLELSGDIHLLWPYIAIGETAHIGRGASLGLGRYRLTPA